MNVQTFTKPLPESVVAASTRRPPGLGPVRWVRRHLGFLLLAVLPSLLGVLYFEVIETPIYMSRSQFVVTNMSPASSLGGLAGFLVNTGLAPNNSYAYSVGAYMSSRDALGLLEKNTNIREMYHRPEADFLNRFPNFFLAPSFENLFSHFSDWVDVVYDATANITTVYVYAFRSDDAKLLNEQLLALSEVAINRLNQRAGSNALATARAEVERLQQRLAAIQAQVNDFRNREHTLDPNQQSTAATALGATLENDLVTARALLAQLQQLAPASPAVAAMRARIATLEQQATAERAKNTGGAGALAPVLSQYDALLLQQQFVQQLVQAAINTLNATETTVAQQRLYVERVSEPSLPDTLYYPYRAELYSFIVIITALMIYGIGRMLFAAIMEHVWDR